MKKINLDSIEERNGKFYLSQPEDYNLGAARRYMQDKESAASGIHNDPPLPSQIFPPKILCSRELYACVTQHSMISVRCCALQCVVHTLLSLMTYTERVLNTARCMNASLQWYLYETVYNHHTSVRDTQ